MTFELFAWFLVPLVPALIALYFLKLKRREVIVSSTFLWKKSLEDLHVNSPFQRLRRSLLLLLQLLVLLALILAASRPVIIGKGETGASRILLIDHSASMNTRESGETRLAAALRQAEALVDGMRPGDRASVIAFAHRSTMVQPLTGEAAKLRQALRAIEPSSYPTELVPALEMAASIAESIPGAEVYVFSDGSFPQGETLRPEFERLRVQFVAIGAARDNLGIVELDVRRDFAKDQRAEIFASVLNSSGQDLAPTLQLYDGELLVDAVTLTIAAGKTATHLFDGSRYSDRVLRVEIEPPAGGFADVFSDDDRAWVRVDPPRPVRLLLIGPRDWFLERLIGVHPAFEARTINLSTYQAMQADGRLAADPADVLLFNGAAPPGAPDRPSFYVGCLPSIPELVGTPGEERAVAEPAPPASIDNPSIIDWDRAHPLNRFVNFADLLIARSLLLPVGPRSRSLIDSEKGSIASTVVLTPSGRPAQSLLILGFAIRETNWPWLPSFPMFFANAIAWLGTTAAQGGAGRFSTGDALLHAAAAPLEGKLAFRDPEGREFPAVLGRSGELVFPMTAKIGVYELRAGDDVVARYPVSLLSHRESQIAPGKEIRLGAGGAAAAITEIPKRQELWKWLALAALAAVLVEWWVFNRRIAV